MLVVRKRSHQPRGQRSAGAFRKDVVAMTSWLAENPELLQSVLEIVDTWDVGSQPLLFLTESTDSDADRSDDSEEPVVASASTALQRSSVGIKRKLQPSTLTSTHHRRRQEIQQLRAYLAQLERQLVLLQAKQLQTDTLPRGSESNSLWHRVAVQHRRLRAIAESHQTDLRRRVEAQTKVARGLVKMIQRARRLETHDVLRSLRAPRVMFRGTVDVPKSEQLVRIREIYDSREAVFSHPNFSSAVSKFQEVRLITDRPSQFAIELCEAWMLPFEHRRTMDALWYFCTKRLQEMLCATELNQATKVHVEELEVVSEISTVATSDRAQGHFDGRAVMKRFVGDDHDAEPAIVMDVRSSPNRDSTGGFDGVRMQIESYTRALPVSMGVGTTISRVQVVDRFVVAYTNNPRSRYHAGLLVNLLLSSIQNTLGVMQETVETVVLTCK